MEEPGLTVAELQNNQNYIDDVIAIMMPNFTPGLDINSPQQFELPGGRIIETKNRDDWQNWRKWTVTLDELQTATNLEFFSYLDEPTRNLIFNKAGSHVQPSSPLLAESIFTSDLARMNSDVFIDSSIGQNNVVDIGIAYGQSPVIPEQFSESSSSFKISRDQDSITKIDTSQFSIRQIGVKQSSPFKVGISEIDIFPITARQISKFKVSPFEIDTISRDFSQTSTPQVGLTQISPFQIGSNEIGSNEIGFKQVGIGETSFIQNRFSQTGSSQISPSKVGFNQINSNQVDSFEINPAKISFPSSIPPEQFFSSHNSTPKNTNVLNNSATEIWSDLLQTETQLDIDFQVTDLPKGQLAEATITGFNDSGIPNAGTIMIDHDANGVGWFIDSTPLDNSEFSVVGDKADREDKGEYYLLAAAESEASAKYDLLTAVLHELAHLYGFIDGYAGFDANVETENGTNKFIGDDFEATLRGEHLDKSAHPYDLLNTHLAPGMRKLPSELDVQILQTILAEESPLNPPTLGDLDRVPPRLGERPRVMRSGIL